MTNDNGKVFEFALGAQVEIECSGEAGEVIGRADFISSSSEYRVRYAAADGRAVEGWWFGAALKDLNKTE